MKIPLAQDPLGEALHFLRMSGVFYARSEFTAPWALALPAFEDESEAAFSRAFKRFLGFPPGAVRRVKSDQSAQPPDVHSL